MSVGYAHQPHSASRPAITNSLPNNGGERTMDFGGFVLLGDTITVEDKKEGGVLKGQFKIVEESK